MTRSLPLLLFRAPSLLVFVSAILHFLHAFTHKQPRSLLTILQSLVGKTAFLPADGLFSMVRCLVWWFLLFLASLLSAVPTLMLEEMHQL